MCFYLFYIYIYWYDIEYQIPLYHQTSKIRRKNNNRKDVRTLLPNYNLTKIKSAEMLILTTYIAYHDCYVATYFYFRLETMYAHVF